MHSTAHIALANEITAYTIVLVKEKCSVEAQVTGVTNPSHSTRPQSESESLAVAPPLPVICFGPSDDFQSIGP